MRNSATQHIIGMTGQVASVSPLLIITIYLSRNVGLEVAGIFTVLVGASAAAYSTALWGLRTTILLDRFRSFTRFDFLGARILGLSLAVIAIFLAGFWLDVGPGIIAGITFLRVCDGLIDLSFSMSQVRLEGGQAIIWYARQHVEKLGIFVGGLIAVALLDTNMFEIIFVICGALSLALALRRVAAEVAFSRNERSWTTISRVRKVLARASWFAIAAAMCAVVTSAPRISLAWLYTGEQLGVIGVSLSVSTFFGMVFYTTWIRFQPRFREETGFGAVARGFIFENVVLALICLLGSWLVLPAVVAFVFEFPSESDVVQARNILAASVVFFGGMNTSNLYKITGAVWMEIVTYAMALSVSAIVAMSFPYMQRTEYLMTLAGVVMLVIGLLSFFAPPRENWREQSA